METLVLKDTDSLTLVAEGSYALDTQAHYVDRTAAGHLTPGNQLAEVPTTDAVTVTSAPASGSMRLVKELLIHNPSGGAAAVQLRLIRGAGVYIVADVSIAAGKTFVLSSGAAI